MDEGECASELTVGPRAAPAPAGACGGRV